MFFDVKPIAVKAYGGRRYCSTSRLSIDRKQKTRGFFYLFVSYDVKTGKRFWALMPGKDSACVCQFMRKLRRHYRGTDLWVALDQDRSHPCKSRMTRRLMKELGLRWISLPKGSPNDNPVETIFSTLDEAVLQCSNDPDIDTMHKRITRVLRATNRRRDRFIRIPYLPDSNKH